jgi:hypothetical protein
MSHAAHYFDRAIWAFMNAKNDKIALNAQSHLCAAAIHACQSLKESLSLIMEENPDDEALRLAVKGLPHSELIENIRNTDLHGWPLPICSPNLTSMMMVSKPGKPVKISSSQGVPVQVQFSGMSPKVTNPNRKAANVQFGGATVVFGCDNGRFTVHDFSTNRAYFLLNVIEIFLKAAHPIVQSLRSMSEVESDLESGAIEESC